MNRIFILTIVTLLLCGFTVAYTQESEVSEICAVSSDLHNLLKDYKAPDIREDLARRVLNGLDYLCQEEPFLRTVREGREFDWLIQADLTLVDLTDLSYDLVKLEPSRIAGNLYKLQKALIPFRDAAYEAKIIREVVIREVTKEIPCPEDKNPCKEILTGSARSWSQMIHRMTDNYDRMNTAIQIAKDVMHEIDRRKEVSPIDVSGWISQFDLALKDTSNYNRKWFGLTDSEQTTLNHILTDMRSKLASCMHYPR